MANEVKVVYVFDADTGSLRRIERIAEDGGKKAGDKAGKGFKKTFDRGIKGVKSSIDNVTRSISGKLLSAVVALGAAFTFKKAISEANELEKSFLGLRSVANATGNDIGEVERQAQRLASDGLIPIQDVTASLQNLIINFNGDLDKSVKTFEALTNAAAFNRQGQLSLGEAVRGASEGLKNDLSIKVDNAGITKNLSNINKEYAASIGTTVGRLTDAQKAQAEFVGIQKEAAIFQGNYNKLLDTFQASQAAAATSTRFLLAELGNIVTRSPAAIAVLRGVADTISGLTRSLRQTAEGGDPLRPIILSALDFAKSFNSFVTPAIVSFARVGSVVFDGTVLAINSAIAAVATLGDGISRLLNLVGVDNSFTQFFQDLGESTRKVAEESFVDFEESVGNLFNPIGLEENIDSFITRLQSGVNAAKPILQDLQKTTQKTVTETGKSIDKTGRAITQLVNQAIVQTTSKGIQELTKSLVLGEKGFGNFATAVFGILGSLATKLGETLLFTGIGIESLKSLSGAAAIAAGAGLIALGTILSSLGGGGEGGLTPGGAGASGFVADSGGGVALDAPETLEPAERDEPDTRVNLVIQGDVLDSEESSLKIVQLLNDAFERDGAIITQGIA